jgi:hypothetical protein
MQVLVPGDSFHRSIKPLNFLDVTRWELRQNLAVSRVNFRHGRRASFIDLRRNYLTGDEYWHL